MIYLLDTNTISDWMEFHSIVSQQIEAKLNAGHVLLICDPVHFELRRGLLWKNKTRKLRILREMVLPLLDSLILESEDWLQASQFWSDATRKGWKIDDIDLLLAAVAYRLDATIVSSDNDFEALPVKRENWREK